MPIALRPAPTPSRIAPWHCAEDRFHHSNAECIYAGTMGRCERRPGDDGRPPCQLCVRLNRMEDELDAGAFPMRF